MNLRVADSRGHLSSSPEKPSARAASDIAAGDDGGAWVLSSFPNSAGRGVFSFALRQLLGSELGCQRDAGGHFFGAVLNRHEVS